MHTPGSGTSGYGVLLCVQVVFLIVFAVCTKYDDGLLPSEDKELMSEIGPVHKKHVPSYPREYTLETNCIH